MKPIVEKVLERLAYERLLLTSGMEPRKRQITLRDALEAAAMEMRIYQILPAILLYKPKILRGIKKDLKNYPKIVEQIEKLFEPDVEKKNFFGVPIADCQKAALAFQNYLRALKQKRKHRLFNLRLSENDWQSLKQISKVREISNYSDIVRTLIHEAVQK